MKDVCTIVCKLLEVEVEITKDKGPFNFFALFLRESETKWDILVASEWIDKDVYGSIRYISSKIQNRLTVEEFLSTSGIEIIDSDNPNLENIYKNIEVEHSSETEIENQIFFGFWINKAYIITARRPTKMILTSKQGGYS